MPFVKKEPRSEKKQEVVDLKELMNVSTIILTDYQGLDVKGMAGLRKKLRECGGGCVVTKNTLFTLAAAGTQAEPLSDGLAGPTAIVYSDDPIGAAKSIQDYVKGPKAIKVKIGVVDGRVVSSDEIVSIAKIPPKEQLYAMVVGGLQSPITGLVGTLNSMLAGLVMTLQAVADQKAA